VDQAGQLGDRRQPLLAERQARVDLGRDQGGRLREAVVRRRRLAVHQVDREAAVDGRQEDGEPAEECGALLLDAPRSRGHGAGSA
jgi:hypothetical protein